MLMADIGWSGLAVSLLLVGLAIGLSMWRGLGLEGSIAWASVRALVQLLAVDELHRGRVLDRQVDPDRLEHREVDLSDEQIGEDHDVG